MDLLAHPFLSGIAHELQREVAGGRMTAEPAFLFPEPELVETIRAGLEAHKRNEQERNARWIAYCLELLHDGDK